MHRRAVHINTSTSRPHGRLITTLETLEQRLCLATTWQATTLSFHGPTTHEMAEPNPFLDYRLNVTFAHTDGTTYVVPGFYNGDGEGNGSGDVWQVRFTPDRPGTWNYAASFRQGDAIAVNLSPTAGTATGFDGEDGSFTAAPRDDGAPGFLADGRLEYVGEHYLKQRDGANFVKVGINSPENFLGYGGFDNTPASLGYTAHAADWNAGDPDWNNGAGKAIVGAVNYLADAGINSVYFLSMNIGGDGQDTWPFASTDIDPSGDDQNDDLHYDVSKLAQWEILFDHAQRKGLMLHVVLSETEEENKEELDNGTLGVERKLYYREMVARLGHHNAVLWNVCEEYDTSSTLFGSDDIIDFATYIRAVDPYDHPITVHNWGPTIDDAFEPLLGSPVIDATSMQLETSGGYGSDVESWRDASAAAGHKWVVNIDEYRNGTISSTTPHDMRKQWLWPTLMSGGGIEHYFDAQDQALDDFTPYTAVWNWSKHIRSFLADLPVASMTPSDELLSDEARLGGNSGQVFAKQGSVYALYYPETDATGTLDLSAESGEWTARWFDPRNGGFVGSPFIVNASDEVSVGAPPNTEAEDWALILKPRIVLAAPDVTLSEFQRDSIQAELRVHFSGDVLGSLERGDFNLRNTTLGTNIDAAAFTMVTTNVNGNTLVRLRLSQPIARGRIELKINQAAVANADGVTLSEDKSFAFTFQPGDADGNGAVNFDDLLALARAYNTSGRHYANGNLDGDLEGNVNFDDLLLLARNYGQQAPALSPPLAAPAAASVDPRSKTRTRASASILG